MLDPKRCIITRNPVLSPDGRVEYTATMTFNVRESIQAELEQRDFKTDGALDPRIVDRLQKLVWKAVYGDLIAPVTHLIAQATQLCNKSMPQPTKNVTYLSAQLVTMLRLKLLEPKKKDKSPVTASGQPDA